MKSETIKRIDRYVGTPIVILAGIFGRLFKQKQKKIQSILVIMFWGIGSNINALPILEALKRKYPQSKIQVLAPYKNKDIFYENSLIDTCIFVDLSFFGIIKTIFEIRNKFDLVIDTEHWLNISAILSFFAAQKRIGFSNRLRSLIYTDTVTFDPGKHAVLNNLDLASLAGAKMSDLSLQPISYPKKSSALVDRFLRNSRISAENLIIGICPGSGDTVKERRWPKERFSQVADWLISQYKAHVIFIGSKEESKLIADIKRMMKNEAIDNCGMSLSETIALIERFNLFISNDTGPMHIAAAQGVKTIGIFGPETPVIFGPYGKGNISLFKDKECSPCIKVYEGSYANCHDNKCIRMITVDDVKEAINKILVKKRQ